MNLFKAVLAKPPEVGGSIDLERRQSRPPVLVVTLTGSSIAGPLGLAFSNGVPVPTPIWLTAIVALSTLAVTYLQIWNLAARRAIAASMLEPKHCSPDEVCRVLAGQRGRRNSSATAGLVVPQPRAASDAPGGASGPGPHGSTPSSLPSSVQV